MRRLVVLLFGCSISISTSCAVSSSSNDESLDADPEVLQVGHLVIDRKYSEFGKTWQMKDDFGTDFKLLDREKLIVKFRLNNDSESEHYKFTGWCYGKNSPSANDNLGNSVRVASYDLGTGVITDVRIHEEFTLGPAKSLWMAIPVERPVDGANALILRLPAEAFGTTGEFRLRIDLTKVTSSQRPPRVATVGIGPREPKGGWPLTTVKYP